MQKLKAWEEKFETEQKLKERKELLKDEKLRKKEEEKRLRYWDDNKFEQEDKISGKEENDTSEINKTDLN